MKSVSLIAAASLVSMARPPASYSTNVHQLLSLSAAVRSEPFLRTAPDFTRLIPEPGSAVRSLRTFPSVVMPGPTWTPIGWPIRTQAEIVLYAEKPWLSRALLLGVAFDDPAGFRPGPPVEGAFADMVFLVGLGGVLEDSTWLNPSTFDPRYLRHFTDPQNGYVGLKGTKGEFSGGFDLEGRAESSIRWATNPVNEFSIDRLSSLYRLAISAPHPEARRCYAEQLFVGLGAQVHLIEDACQPSHVRDDSHSASACLPDGDSLLETYGHHLIASTGSAAAAVELLVAGQATATKFAPRDVRYGEYLKICAEKVSRTFFSDESLRSSPVLWNAIQGGPGSPLPSPVFDLNCENALACVTLDTLRSSEGLALEERSPGERVLVYRGTEMPHHDLAKLVMHWTGTFQAPRRELQLVFDDDIARNNAHVLLPFAEAAAKGFMDYFFRGQLDVELSGDDLVVHNVSSSRPYSDAARGTAPGAIGDFGEGSWWFGLLGSEGFLHSPMRAELLRSTMDVRAPAAGGQARFHGLGRALALERHLLSAKSGMGRARGVAAFIGTIGVEPGVAFRTFELPPLDSAQSILSLSELESPAPDPPRQTVYELQLAPGTNVEHLEGEGSARFDGSAEVDSMALFLAGSDALVAAQEGMRAIGWTVPGFASAIGGGNVPGGSPFPSYTNISIHLGFAERSVVDGVLTSRARGAQEPERVPTVEARAIGPLGFAGQVTVTVPLTHGPERAKRTPAGFVRVTAEFDGSGAPARTWIALGG